MKALQILPRVWSNTCSVSRLSWDRVTALISVVSGPCNTTHVVRRSWFIWRHCVEEQDGNSLPQRDSTTSSRESHHIKHQRVLGLKGGRMHWNKTQKPPLEGPSGLLAVLPWLVGTLWQPLTLEVLCIAKCYHPAQRGISALFSSTATLRFFTLGPSSLAGLGEVWVHTSPHVLLPPGTPLGKSTFQHHFQLMSYEQSIHPSIYWIHKKACHTLDWDEPTQRRSHIQFRELRRAGTTAPDREISTASQRAASDYNPNYFDKITK